MHPFKTLFLALALTVGLGFFPALAELYQTSREEANIRIDSTPLSEPIGVLSGQDVVEVVELKYDWYKIKLPPKFSCWAYSKFIKNGQKEIGVVEGDNLNIRNRPSLNGNVIGSLDKGDKVNIKNKKKDWYEIACYPYAFGWVHKKLLKKLQGEQELDYFLQLNLTKLSLVNDKERKIIEKKIIEKGKEVVPLIEKQLSQLDKPPIYSIIQIFSQLGKENSELISYFFDKIDSRSLKISAIYLDTLENIILKDSPKLPFYYLFKENQLSQNQLQKAYIFLKSHKGENNIWVP
jgi:hypothetical protein